MARLCSAPLTSARLGSARLLFALAAGKKRAPRMPTQGVGPDLHVPNPKLDYIPPTLISLYLTDTGGHCPSSVYRLLTEYYSPEDHML